ncbi:hypothetical protein [Neptuniibacter halophilus]|uniref:hypothetical protein n=1 Tax=Neptuniibacter halophilus TaxID=651666 RepID=UPI0025738C76|nr:hypothetical protein [Neptuniibacter halophilus]
MYVLLLGLSLAACDNRFRQQIDQQFYLLDTQRGLLCLEQSTDCYPLSLVEPSFAEAIIARGYGLTGGAYSWSAAELQNLMLNPPDELYPIEPLAKGVYRLPPVFAVHSVWDVLANEHYQLYDRDDDRYGTPGISKPLQRRY